MNLHSDFSSPGFDLEPVAPLVGPFCTSGFLSAWWSCVPTGDELVIVEADDAVLPLVRTGSTIEFAGAAHLTDYHSPLGPGAGDLIATYARSLESGIKLRFDSLPAEAVDVVVKGLGVAGIQSRVVPDEIVAVLDLPDDPEEYLARLDKKQRHEVRRKRRRFDEALGEARVEEGGESERDAFVAMHRSAVGEKGEFMTDAMKSFFAALLDDAGARLDVLYGGGDTPIAAAVAFEDDDAYYLYNSAYDPGVADASPGIVLVAELIERAVLAGKRRFDFLKGDEVYKFRLGARVRPLSIVEART